MKRSEMISSIVEALVEDQPDYGQRIRLADRMLKACEKLDMLPPESDKKVCPVLFRRKREWDDEEQN